MDWEFDWLFALQEIHNPLLDKLMIFFSTLGNAGILWIAVALGCLIFPKSRKCGIQMFVSMLVVLFIGNLVLKNLFHRDRPCWICPDVPLLVDSPKDFSFPSGHSMNSFTSALTIFFYDKKAGTVALITAALIAFSRLYNFVHFPTDVFTGIFIGIGVAIAVNYFYKKWEKKREKLSD